MRYVFKSAYKSDDGKVFVDFEKSNDKEKVTSSKNKHVMNDTRAKYLQQYSETEFNQMLDIANHDGHYPVLASSQRDGNKLDTRLLYHPELPYDEVADDRNTTFIDESNRRVPYHDLLEMSEARAGTYQRLLLDSDTITVLNDDVTQQNSRVENPTVNIPESMSEDIDALKAYSKETPYGDFVYAKIIPVLDNKDGVDVQGFVFTEPTKPSLLDSIDMQAHEKYTVQAVYRDAQTDNSFEL